MIVVTDKKSLASQLFSQRQYDKKIGFVPTMGALHQGHLALVKRALKENDFVVVSIYVNPTQFDNQSDLQKYPRILQSDKGLLEGLNGDMLLYTPNNEDIYGEEVRSEAFNFSELENKMEGKYREGHFDGVATVVSKLFEIVKPNRAYFGEKDFQQLLIIKELVRMKNLPVEIIGCPIVREANGLAMSSRNKRLTPEQREKATIIHQTLSDVREKFESHTIPALNEMVRERFLQEPFLELEYFQIAEASTLVEVKQKKAGDQYRAFIAAYCGEVRLIDNMALN